MSGSVRRALYSTGALALLLSPLPFAAPATAADPAPSAPSVAPLPADPFVPPPAKRLDPRDIILKRGDKPGQAQLVTRDGGPLAVLLAVTSGDGRVKVVSPGADFRRPSTWRQLGFGDICWKYTRLPDTDSFVLPESRLPFTGPPGDWRYSNVIVGTERGPVVFNKPLPGEFVTGQGSPIQSVISCVAAAPRERSYRADPLPPASPVASAATGLQPLASASADTGLQPIASPDASPSPTASSADIEAYSARKVTICHATSSESNPYTLITVSVNAIANSGHLQHTGPLYPQVGWGDVIPPVDGVTDGVNWPSGESLLQGGCQVEAPPVVPPLIPITPELPIAPEPPIIEIRPPVRPEPPIATLPASPSGTATPPIATLPASPSGTATPPPTVSASGQPSPETTVASPEATTGPVASGTVVDDLNRYCESKDEGDLPASLTTLRADLIITNGVSSLTLKRPFTSLYCAARPLPGTVAAMPSDVNGGDALVDTGFDPRGTAAASLVLIGIGLLLVPTLTRRHH